MVLTKSDILKRISNNDINFKPSLDGFQLQPHSVDLRLGYSFHLPKTWELTEKGRLALNIDPLLNKASKNFNEIILKPSQYFELLPKEFVVAITLERIILNAPDLMGVLYPRSSINRRGLSVDLSGVIDVNYNGFLMIPIVNNTFEQIIRIYPGERICSVVFETLSSSVSPKDAESHGLNKAKYNNNAQGFIGSKTDKDEEVELIRKGKISKIKEQYCIKKI
jgi:deoxycytidine triphosphate deaminase